MYIMFWSGVHKLSGGHYLLLWMYRQISNISRTLVSNKIVDHSDEVEAAISFSTPNISRTLVSNKIVDRSDVVGTPVGAYTTISPFSYEPGFNALGENNCKTRLDIFKCLCLFT